MHLQMTRYMSALMLGLLLNSPLARGQEKEPRDIKLLGLMEEIFEQVGREIAEIDPGLQRIALYRLTADGKYISAPLREHFENRLVEIFRTLQTPVMVSLPEINTLKITSSDTSFSVHNALPSPDELWRISRRLRVDAVLEGKLAYIPDKSLILDLRLNKTGTNEVLWARSFSAFAHARPDLPRNPLQYSFNVGLEVFPVEIAAGVDTLLRSDFNRKLTQYSVYLGVYQALWANSRLRYEFRFGASFFAEGMQFKDTFFREDAFYGLSSAAPLITYPVSFNVRSLLYSSLIEKKEKQAADWLAMYASLTRYFARGMPDLTGLGLGLRSDLSDRFSFSTGFSMVFGRQFDSTPIKKTGESLRLKISGLQYEIFFLQYTF